MVRGREKDRKRHVHLQARQRQPLTHLHLLLFGDVLNEVVTGAISATLNLQLWAKFCCFSLCVTLKSNCSDEHSDFVLKDKYIYGQTTNG